MLPTRNDKENTFFSAQQYVPAERVNSGTCLSRLIDLCIVSSRRLKGGHGPFYLVFLYAATLRFCLKIQLYLRWTLDGNLLYTYIVGHSKKINIKVCGS